MLLAQLASPEAVRWSGLVQADLTWADDSSDQLADATGRPLNQDAFVLRRGRLRAEGETRFTAWVAEADFNTVEGPQAGFRQVEGALRWAGAGALEGLGLRLAAGVFAIPFGHEVGGERDAERLFTERSTAADALFPGQLDVGARLEVAWEPARLIVAVQNGEPLGGSAFPGEDPNDSKDFTVRIDAVAPLGDRVRLAGGLSALTGTGFHAGTQPTKERIIWRDLNEDGIVQTSEITSLPPAAGTPSADFDRFGLGADFRVEIDLPGVGPLRIAAEGVVATNLDRGLRPADPVLIGRDQRALGGALSLTQALGPADVGVRYDTYAPELDRSEVRAGTTVRAAEHFDTLKVAAGLRIEAARLVVEYQLQDDTLGRDAEGNPADLKNNALKARLQVAF